MTNAELVLLGGDLLIILLLLNLTRNRVKVAQRILDEPRAVQGEKVRVLRYTQNGRRPAVLYKGTDMAKAKRIRAAARETHGRRIMLEVAGKLRG